MPEFEAQHLIANYLDRETARIDALIAEKERMLALLEEKRAALISRVVTRGLDPNAPLKPSNAPWFDETPTGLVSGKAETGSFNRLALAVSVNASDQPVEGDGFGVLKTALLLAGHFCQEKISLSGIPNMSVWPVR